MLPSSGPSGDMDSVLALLLILFSHSFEIMSLFFFFYSCDFLSSKPSRCIGFLCSSAGCCSTPGIRRDLIPFPHQRWDIHYHLCGLHSLAHIRQQYFSFLDKLFGTVLRVQINKLHADWNQLSCKSGDEFLCESTMWITTALQETELNIDGLSIYGFIRL